MKKPEPLSYSAYINDRAVVDALRIPQPAPQGQNTETWPTWHVPGEAPASDSSTPWRPGDPWPEGRNWSHHEVLFIRTHQAFEVWFALILHEIDGVLRQARDRVEVMGASFPSVELSRRHRDARGFPPGRFPLLAATAREFQQEVLRNRVFLMPSPGRHFQSGVTFGTLPPERLREWAAGLDRAAAAMEVTIPFFDVLATMSPAQFMEFRGRLAPASGFGSRQFREIEMVLGLKEVCEPRLRPEQGTSEADEKGRAIPPPMLRPSEQTPAAQAMTSFYRHHEAEDWERLVRRFREPSLRDLVYSLLNTNVFSWPSSAAADTEIDRFAAKNVKSALSVFDRAPVLDEVSVADHIEGLGEVLSHRETVVAALLSSREEEEVPQAKALGAFLVSCMNIDGALLRWRDRHVRFVETMIGRRPGTGGAGVNYLRETIDITRASYLTHAFPCLWQARSLVQSY